MISADLGDYATHDAARYPHLWDGCKFAACAALGATGATSPDFSGNANHLKMAGSTTTDYLWDRVDGIPAWSFSKADSGRLQSDYSLCFSPATESFSISCFANLKSFSTSNSCQFVTIGTDDYQCLTFGVYYEQFVLISGQSGSWDFNWSGVIASFNKNYYISYVCDRHNNVSKFYIDSFHVKTSYAPTIEFNNLTIKIGSHYGEPHHWAHSLYMSDCYMDDIRIYNRVLDPDEIQLLSRQRGISYIRRPRRIISLPRFNPALAQRSNIILPAGVWTY